MEAFQTTCFGGLQEFRSEFEQWDQVSATPGTFERLANEHETSLERDF